MTDQSDNPSTLRVLVVRVGAMGDVLHGMPAVAALRKAFPNAHIGWAVEPRWQSLLRVDDTAQPLTPAQPMVDRVHLVPTREWSKQPFSIATMRSVLALRRQLRAERYDVAVDLQGSVRSSVIARMSGAKQVVGLEAPREAPARWLYKTRVAVRAAHVVRQAAELMSAAAGQRLGPLDVTLPIDPAAETWAKTIVGDDTRPLAVLAPTAGWPAKQWPASRFGDLARALDARGYRVLINASPTGTDAIANLVEVCSNGTAKPVTGTIPQLTALLRRASLMVAGDSGPLHLAAALKVPTVGIFGPTDPLRTGPFGFDVKTVRHPSSITDHRRHQKTEAGLAQITVDEVLAACDALSRARA